MFQLKLLIMILLGGFCTILSARAGLELCSSKVSRVLVIFFSHYTTISFCCGSYYSTTLSHLFKTTHYSQRFVKTDGMAMCLILYTVELILADFKH